MKETIAGKPFFARHKAVQIIIFISILLGLIIVVSRPLISTDETYNRGYNNVAGFYELQQDAVDVVFVGSSRIYQFWNPMLAYAHSGIRSVSFATPGQIVEAARYLIEEALKTQPHAAFVVNLDDIKEGRPEFVHQLVDYLHFNGTKLRLLRMLRNKKQLSFADMAEYIFPVIRYHSRWQSLKQQDFFRAPDGMMGASYSDEYLYMVKDISEKFYKPAGSTELDEPTRKMLDELVGYCREHNVPLILIQPPQANVAPETLAMRTAARIYAESLGATVLDMQDAVKDIGLDPARDFYNPHHTNVHGSFKYTVYVTELLSEALHLPDRRGEADSAPWDKGLTDYTRLTASALLPFEWQPENRAALNVPVFTAESLAGGGVSITFASVPGADGYEIFAKNGEREAWRSVCDQRDAGTVTDAEGKTGCTYLVVAYDDTPAGRMYGTADYLGSTATSPTT